MIVQNNLSMTQSSFGSKFSATDIGKIKKGKVKTAFELGMRIGSGEIRPQDGAKAQLADIDAVLHGVSSARGNKAFDIGKALYFKLHTVEKDAPQGIKTANRVPTEGLNNHEIESFASGFMNTVVDIGFRLAHKDIVPERALAQISARQAKQGENKNLTMLSRQLRAIVSENAQLEQKTAIQVTVDTLVKKPIQAIADAFKGVLPSEVDTAHAAKSFEESFKPRQKAPSGKKAKAFEQAFTPNLNPAPSEKAGAFEQAFAKKAQR